MCGVNDGVRKILLVMGVVTSACLAVIMWVGRTLISLLDAPARSIQAFGSRKVVRLWFRKSFALLLGTLAYNLFALLILTPLLRKFFPPLSPWEQVRGFVGASTRATYRDLLPYIGPGLWILGNGLLFALLNQNLLEAQKTVKKGGHENG